MPAPLIIAIRPSRLREHAERTAGWEAISLGGIATALEFGVIFGTLTAWGQAMPPTTVDYIEAVLFQIAGATALLLLLAMLLGLFIIRLFAAYPPRVARAILLSPLTVLLPSLIWGVLFAATRAPGLHAHSSGGPVSLLSIPVQIGGHSLWFVPIVILWAVWLNRGLGELAPVEGPVRCGRCGYELTGLPAGAAACPECGVSLQNVRV